MNFHYSLYRSNDHEGNDLIIDLAKVVSVRVGETSNINYFFIECVEGGDDYGLPIKEFDSFLTAWNAYKYAAAAAQFVKIPDTLNPVIACQSALRIDEHIGFLAGEKLKQLAEMTGGES